MGNGLQQFHNNGKWRVDEITMEGHEVYTQTFLGSMNPNIFILSNPSRSTLKIGISTLPRSDRFEFKVEPNSTECFGRPITTGQVSILNDSDQQIKVILFSMCDDFDPTILKNLNVILEGSQLLVSSSIDYIGNGVCMPVSVTNFSVITSLLEAIRDKKVSVAVDTVKVSNLQTTELWLEQLLTVVKNIMLGRKGTLEAAHYLSNCSEETVIENYNGSDSIAIQFDWLCNDSDQTLGIYNRSGLVLTVLPHETWRDFTVEIGSGDELSISGDTPMYRAKYWKVE